MTIGTVLAMINLVNQVSSPFSYIPYLLLEASQAFTSSERIEKIFDLVEEDKNYIQKSQDENLESAIIINNCSFEWKQKENEISNLQSNNIEEYKHKDNLEEKKALLINEKSLEKIINKRILNDITLNIRKSELIFIIGGLGSGKSSLLHALNNDLITISGGNPNLNDFPIIINGKVAYVDQNPWLQSMSVKDNICFLLNYEETKFQKVIQACQLEEDVKVLQDGINTEVGEKGSNLS